MAEEDQDKLIKAINRLTKVTQRSYSIGWAILRGIFYSIGWIIGLAILATLAIYILPKFGEGNVVGKFLQEIADAIKNNRY